jgi:hypothetical protein
MFQLFLQDTTSDIVKYLEKYYHKEQNKMILFNVGEIYNLQ